MKAKKSLGQNFLKSEIALQKIVEAGEINVGDIILEIGPGKGALTSKLLETKCKVVAIEKDNELFEFLKTKFAREIESGSLVLVHGDILEFSISDFQFSNYKIIANIPYNITGAILKKFLTETTQPERMILMIQHEVAQRIMGRRNPAVAKAKAGEKESILSISVKAYGEPKMVMKVDKRYFSPAPKVNSAVIAIRNISRKFFEENQIKEERFWEIVKKGFAHKRKMLSGNLKDTAKKDILVQFGNRRAEDLNLQDWVRLAR